MTREFAAIICDVDEYVRWEVEARAALPIGAVVIDRAVVSDYQGWGVLLFRHDDAWGVLPWSYGSCSGCDEYEDLHDYADPSPIPRVVEALRELIRTYEVEADARAAFDAGKGW